MTNKPLVISYLRFSSARQELGDSFRRQRKLRDDYCQKHGLTVTDILEDPGISAFRGKHKEKGALSAFLKLVEDGKIPAGSVLLVEALDRLSRENPYIALGTFCQIINAGIAIVTLNDNQTYTRDDISGEKAMTGLLISVIGMTQAHKESYEKSRRLSDAWEAKRKTATTKPLTATLPRWLQMTKVDGERKIIIKEAEAALIREIFSLADSGIGSYRIVQIMRGKLIDDKEFTTNYIKKVLRNPAVKGDYVQKTRSYARGIHKKINLDTIPGYYPTIIDKSMFDRVNGYIDSRLAKSPGRVDLWINILQGLVKTTNGGTVATKRRAVKGMTEKSVNERLLIDTTADQRGITNKSSFPATALELAVIDAISNLQLPNLDQRNKTDAGQRKQLEQRQAAIKAQLESLKSALVNIKSSPLAAIEAMQTLETEYTNNQKEIDSLTNKESQTIDDDYSFLTGLPAEVMYQNALQDNDGRARVKKALNNIINNIVVSFSKNGSGVVAQANCLLTLVDGQQISFKCRCHVEYVNNVEINYGKQISTIFGVDGSIAFAEGSSKNYQKLQTLCSMYHDLIDNKLHYAAVAKKYGYSLSYINKLSKSPENAPGWEF